jgi:hypothetical protein
MFLKNVEVTGLIKLKPLGSEKGLWRRRAQFGMIFGGQGTALL